jgi:TolB-like protein/Tfp pilus assembly protein PilF
LLQGKHDEAIAEGKKAVALVPSSALSNATLGTFLAWADRPKEAILVLKNALRLNPFPIDWQLLYFGNAYLIAGRYEEALSYYKKAQERNPDNIWSYFFQASIYGHLDREEEARAPAKELLRLNPKFSIEHWVKWPGCKNRDKWNLIINGLRKAGLPEKLPTPLPDKPSIAVLPFTNLSDDPKQEYFSDGMTDDLITDLSKISGLLVIARNSSFTYKGKTVKVQQVGKELGVRYVLEGSVRRAGNDVRINAQLIDATTGHHEWADRYDGKWQNIFALQDRITNKIVAALKVELSVGERKLVESMETESIDAYDAFLKGYKHYWRQTVDDLIKALQYFEKAIELDKNYGRAYAMLARTYWIGPRQGQKEWYVKMALTYEICMLRARHYLQIAMKRPTSTSRVVASLMAIQRHQYEKAMAEAERALALDPSGYGGNHTMGYVLLYVGRPMEAIRYFKRTLQLDPLVPGFPLFFMGLAHFTMSQFNEAVNLITRALTHFPKHASMKCVLAAAYAQLGRNREAVDALKDCLKLYSPGTPDLNTAVSIWPFKEQKDSDSLAEGFIKAGLPGRPSDYCKILKQNKLTGKEIRKLLFGYTMKGTISGMQWSIGRDKEGKCKYTAPWSNDTGKNWIQGDSLFTQWETHHEGRKYDMEIYRNPGGTPDRLNDYCLICDFGVVPFSVAD